MWRLKAWLCKWFGRNYTADICGHKFKRFAPVQIFGRTVYCRLQKWEDYCGSCQAEMAIRCGICGRPILTQELITLQGVDLEMPPEKRVREGAVLHEGKLVCCCRFSCSEMGLADVVGKWVPPGKVHIASGQEWLEMMES